MPNNIDFVSKHEYSIRIDNALVKMIIDSEKRCEEQIVGMTLHMHSHAEIFACTKGEVEIETPFYNIHLLPGDVAIIPAGLSHKRYTHESDTGFHSIGIVCTLCGGENQRDVFSGIASHIVGKKPYVFRNCTDFCKAASDMLTDTSGKNDFILSLGFVNELCKLFNSSNDNSIKSDTKTENSAKNIDRLIKLDYLINTKFMTELNNKQIASEIFISERQLARLVRDHYGETLRTLIINKRIETAAVLLEKTSYSAENIALIVGFKSKTAFYNDFSKTYGITPIEYRLRSKR